MESASVIEVTILPYQEYCLKEYIDILRRADTIVVWMNLEEMLPQLHAGYNIKDDEEKSMQAIKDVCRDMADYILSKSNARIFWLSFEKYFLHQSTVIGHRERYSVNQINCNLQEYFLGKIVFIDLEHLIAECSIKCSFSVKNKFRWNFPYSKYLVEMVAAEMWKQYLVETYSSKKCLILDCDGVLWGGILSEDGIENIRIGSSGIGREYQEFQRFVLSLYNRGVILAVCTKNDLDDIRRVFREHSDMVLREEHIACIMANWGNKPDNIRTIAEKLNISTASMVFIDDSVLEIEAVKAILPEVTAIKYHREEMYKDFQCFNLKDDICYEEVLNRNITYRTDQYRQELKAVSCTYDEYVSALEMHIDIHRALPSEFGRLVELTKRTNKCTNGVRCTLQNIMEWGNDIDMGLYSVYLEDKFSNLGLVGAFCVRNNKLLLFSLSCRALGRNVEEKMLDYIQERYQIEQVDFLDTGKNDNLKLLLKRRLD